MFHTCSGGKTAASTVMLGLGILALVLVVLYAGAMWYNVKAIFDPKQTPPVCRPDTAVKKGTAT